MPLLSKMSKYWIQKGKVLKYTVLIVYLLLFLGILSVCLDILDYEGGATTKRAYGKEIQES